MEDNLTTTPDSSPSREDVAASFNDLVSSAEELLRTTASYSGAEIDMARKRLRQQLDVRREQLGNYETVLKDKCRTMADATEKCVQNHPWKALGTAAFIGMIIGHCMAGSSDRR